jgi:O-antigen/teichoic acid export membrane protein
MRADVPNPTLPVLGRKIAFSAVMQYAGKALQLVLAMLTLKLISNFLSENDYGIYAKISEYALFFSTVANLGIFGNLVRMMADKPKDGVVFINALFLRIFTCALFFIPGIIFLATQGSDNVFMLGTLLFFGALFFDFVTSVCDGMMQANYMMGRATIALVAGRVINFAVILILIKGVLNLNDPINIALIFLATFAGSIITALLSLYFVRRKIDWSWEINLMMMKEVFLKSLPFGIINIFNSLYFRFLPDYFAQATLNNSQFAGFNVSFRISQVLSLFSTFLMFSVLPGFKEYIDQKHWQKAHVLFKKIWKLLLGAGLILVVFGSLFGGTIIELLAHKKFILPEFWFVLPLMMLLAAISYGYDLILITIFALDKDIWLIKRESMALAAALIVFSCSYMVESGQLKMLLIILAAITGESFMVISGIIKISRFWKTVAEKN